MTGWEEVTSTALLGTARRTLAVDRLPAPLRLPITSVLSGPTSDPTADLLDAAALATVYRRAGMRPGARRELPDPAQLDDRPVVPVDARKRLSQLLSLHDSDLLGQWLRMAAQCRSVPPPQALPRLLKETVRPELAADVVAATGPRGVWLAGFQPHWHRGIALVTGRLDVPPTRWADASDAERRQWLVDLNLDRARSDEFRDLLERDSANAVRAAGPELVTVLRQGVSPESEVFLEACLDDRKAAVRAAAATMLALIPGSALDARTAARAQAAVRAEGLIRRRLVVTAPEAHDEQLRRDGIPAPPSPPRGSDGEWLVLHIVGTAPLRSWSPDMPGLLADDRWSEVLWYGWQRAARRERDVGWAGALISSEQRAGGPAGRPGSRAAQVAQLLSAFPAPWPEPLAVTVIDWLQATGDFPHDIRQVLDLAARRLPVEAVERVQAVARSRPPDSPARNAFVRAVELMAYRRAMFEELQ